MTVGQSDRLREACETLRDALRHEVPFTKVRIEIAARDQTRVIEFVEDAPLDDGSRRSRPPIELSVALRDDDGILGSVTVSDDRGVESPSAWMDDVERIARTQALRFRETLAGAMT